MAAKTQRETVGGLREPTDCSLVKESFDTKTVYYEDQDVTRNPFTH
jgi:hypothetical protein